MAYSLDNDYQPTTRIRETKDGTVVERVLWVRAATEIDAYNDSDVPARGDSLNLGDGSVSELVYCKSRTIDAVPEAAAESGKVLFQVSLTYEPITRNNPVVNSASCRISAQPQSIHISAVDEDADQDHYGPDGKYDGNGINVTQDGPQGIDIDESVITLEIDYWLHPSAVEAYLATLDALVNKVNDATFSGVWGDYAAGTALYRSYSVGYVTGEMSQVRHEILYRPNATIDVDFADGSTATIAKKGHQYLWKRMGRYSAGDDANAHEILDAHVATVYGEADFSGLNLPAGLTWG
jgi:hypothetical protein